MLVEVWEIKPLKFASIEKVDQIIIIGDVAANTSA
jgi:hypothetical protein